MSRLPGTLLPFLYPCVEISTSSFRYISRQLLKSHTGRRYQSTEGFEEQPKDSPPSPSHLNPLPEDYARSIFTDKCTLRVHAGAGGHGCVSFLRDKFVASGPPNGGDGGSGGNVYIQAVRGETSLHKLARRGNLRAGRGKNGQGRSKGGQRGEDILVQVPVGTVIREIDRYDPVAEEDERLKLERGTNDPNQRGQWRRDKWILYPASKPSEYSPAEFPNPPRGRQSNVASLQPAPPISLDLSTPMEKPMLLAAGAAGGLGNPHFVSKTRPMPKFATRGEAAMSISLSMELKLLADVGFVGLPNAGKSTLLRALSNSRARVGDWAFTTLQPNIGTVVLDNHTGRPKMQQRGLDRLTQFSIADIPGLIPEAHLDKGLGLGFLRHVERARVLAFVIDLSAGDAVEALHSLWRELREFEKLKDSEVNEISESRTVNWKAFGSSISSSSPFDHTVANKNDDIWYNSSQSSKLEDLPIPPISTKPWFVVATKADREGTAERFAELRAYLQGMEREEVDWLSGKNGWRGKLCAVPVSAIRGEGVERIAEWTVGLLGHRVGGFQ